MILALWLLGASVTGGVGATILAPEDVLTDVEWAEAVAEAPIDQYLKYIDEELNYCG